MHKSIANVCAKCYSEFEVIYESFRICDEDRRKYHQHNGNRISPAFRLELVELMKILFIVILGIFFAGCGQPSASAPSAPPATQLIKACNMACPNGGQIAGANECYCLNPSN